MITNPKAGQLEAPLATALDVFRTALVTHTSEVANRDEQLARTKEQYDLFKARTAQSRYDAARSLPPV